MPKFICISGHAQNGKDTTAGMLQGILEEKGYTSRIVHYADLLKYICKMYFDWDGKKDDIGRTLLQRVGTDMIRKKEPDFWVDFVISVAKFFPDEWDYIIVPDTRFPNEINKLREAGFYALHVRVVRDNFVSPLTMEQQHHESEIALDKTEPDVTIHNNTLVNLDMSLRELCDRMLVKVV